MKRVLFIDPFCKNPKYESPNIKLAYGCSVVEKNGCESEIMDFIIPNIENLSENEFLDLKKDFYDRIYEKAEGVNFVYLNCEYGILKSCIEIAIRIKGKCKIIIGGTYINYLYEGKVLDENTEEIQVFDYISLGDIEKDLPYIINQEPHDLFINAGMVDNLDDLPFPMWNKFDLSKYDGKLYLVASKGCSYNGCKFCDERLIWGKKYRYRDPEKVFNEIQHNINTYGINEFFFWDASIAAYPEIQRLCKLISENNVDCCWTALSRVDELDDDLIETMKRSGCKSIEIGIESLNDNTLNELNKGITVGEIKDAVRKLKAHGLIVEGSFLIGYPNESEEEIKNTIKIACELDIDFYRWHNFQPYALFLRRNSGENKKPWIEADLNYPNQLLYKYVSNEVELLDMHMVSKLNGNKISKFPNVKYGNFYIEDIHRLCQLAIDESANKMTVEGHNPYI